MYSYKSEITQFLKLLQTAKKCYLVYQSTRHVNFTLQECGFFVSQKVPYVGASPDSVSQCSCCGRGIFETKCPYSLRDGSTIQSLSYMNEGKLNMNHDYFYQIQAEMLCANVMHGDFCVWTPHEMHVERIYLDEKFCETMLGKAEVFFYEAIVPELLAKYFTRNPVEKLVTSKY